MSRSFPRLNFPSFDFSVTEEKGKLYIFDSLRKKKLLLTPEEWVRQHLVRLLTEHLGYPAGLTQIEKKISVNGLPRRFDLAVMNTKSEVVLLAECKAPHVSITQETIYQAAAYGKVIKPAYYLLTNGISHVCFTVKPDGIRFLENIPPFAVT